MSFFRLICGLSAVMAIASLAACGNIGPLYLPDDPHPPVYVPATPVSAPEPAEAGSMSRPGAGGELRDEAR